MPGNNVFLATVVVLVVTPAVVSWGQSPTAPLVGDKPAPQLDWSHVLRAHHLVESWVRDGDGGGPSETAPLWASGVAGVRVTLRWSGVTAGVGQWPADTGGGGCVDHRRAAVNLVPFVHEATRQALKQLADRLNHIHAKATATGRETGPSGPVEPVGDVAPSLLVDLQVARTPAPIHLDDQVGPGAVFGSFAPGYHGLRMTETDGPTTARQVWVWPGDALAGNIPPKSQLVGLLSASGYQTGDLLKVGRVEGPVLERFEVIHAVRLGENQPVVRLIRGQGVLPATSVSSEALEAMAKRLADFLLRRQTTDGWLAGTYLPSSDRYHPLTAPVQDVALAAYALGRRAVWSSAGNRAETSTNTSEAVRRLVEVLTDRLLRKGSPVDRGNQRPAGMALLLMTLTTGPQLSGHKADRDVLIRRLRAVLDRALTTDRDNTAAPMAMTRPVRALITAALVSAYEQTRDQELKGLVERSLDGLWEKATTRDLVSMQPWLTTAELTLHRLEGPGLSKPSGAGSRWPVVAGSLGRLIQTLRKTQVTSPLRVGPADVVGGFELIKTDRDSPPNPDWQSARVLACLAGALSEPDLRHDRDAIGWFLDCGLAARFLARLMFDESGCYYVRSRADVLGGVRLSMWDNRLGVGPTAMALLATTELLSAGEQLARQGAIR